MKLPLGLYPGVRRVRDHQFILRESCRYDLSTSTNWFATFPPTTWHFIDLQGVPWWKWRAIAKKINFHHVGSHVCKLIRVTPTMSTNFKMFQRCFTNDVTLRLGVFLPIRRCLWRRSRIIFDLDGETVIHGELSGLIKGCQRLCRVYPQKCMPKMAIFQKVPPFPRPIIFGIQPLVFRQRPWPAMSHDFLEVFPNKKSDLFRQIWLTRSLRPRLRSVLPSRAF